MSRASHSTLAIALNSWVIKVPTKMGTIIYIWHFETSHTKMYKYCIWQLKRIPISTIEKLNKI